jgi:predicted permease
VDFNQVGPGYFSLLGTPLVAGREFEWHDTPQSIRVAVVNQTFAKTVFPGADAIGRVFSIEDAPGGARPSYQIVGIVADTKYRDLREALPPIAYLAATQDEESGPFLQAVIRTHLPLGGVRAGLAGTIREVNPAIGVQFQTMEGLVRNTLKSERLMAALSAFFGVLAVLIATIGLYGVMSYMVARRRMEIGIRMALGASRGTVVRMIVREAGVLLAAGLVVGAGLAVVAARSAQALLFGLEPWDPSTLALAAVLLGAVAIAASWLPAHRASCLAPTAALREEA